MKNNPIRVPLYNADVLCFFNEEDFKKHYIENVKEMSYGHFRTTAQ